MPTEEFRFQSASIKNIQMNGDVRYTGGTMNLPDYNEFFNGLDNMGKRVFNTTGYANGKRIDVSADFGIVWQISEKFSLADQYDFLDFREPALSNLNEVDFLGTSMLLPPGPAQPPSPTFAPTFMGMKTKTQYLDRDLGTVLESQRLSWISLPATGHHLGHALVYGRAAERNFVYVPHL